MKLVLALATMALLAFPAVASPAGERNWVVTFSATQSGLPDSPKPPNELKLTTTTVKGKIFFAKKPKEGKSTSGAIKGKLTHADAFEAGGETFTLKLKGKGGFSYSSSGKSSLFLPGKVTKRSGSSDKFGVKKGAKGLARLGTLPATLSFITYGEKKGVHHTHKYDAGGGSTLTIVIGKPQKLD